MSSITRKAILLFLLIILAILYTSCNSEKPTEPGTSIVLNPTLLTFSSFKNDTLPDVKTFNVSNGGSGTLEWLIIDTITWLDINPLSGVSNNTTIQVSVNTTSMNDSMSQGAYNAIIEVISGNAENSPKQVLVSFIINQIPVVGNWSGVYRVITGYQTPAADTTQSTIELRFSDELYFFDSDNNPDAFCEPRGDYSFSGNSITFTETNKNCTQIASESHNPRGTFSLRMPADSLIMLQLNSPDTLKQFYLNRI